MALHLLKFLMIVCLIKVSCNEGLNVLKHTNSFEKKCKPEIIVSDVEPVNFKCDVDAAFCYIFVKDKLLILKNAPHKFEAGYWGIPGGKTNGHETIEQTALRELCEETSIKATSQNLTYVGKLYMQKPFIEYTFHMYCMILNDFPNINVSEEHVEYEWVSLEDIKDKKIMTGGIEALSYFLESLKSLGLKTSI